MAKLAISVHLRELYVRLQLFNVPILRSMTRCGYLVRAVKFKIACRATLFPLSGQINERLSSRHIVQRWVASVPNLSIVAASFGKVGTASAQTQPFQVNFPG